MTKRNDIYTGEGGYAFFSGVDGSRAFITGEFTEDGLTDDVSTLKPSEALSLNEWLADTYFANYPFKGKVVGYFYDENGKCAVQIVLFLLLTILLFLFSRISMQ